MRHRMSLRLRSTAWSASLKGQLEDSSCSREGSSPGRIHHWPEVRYSARKLTRLVSFPSDGIWSGRIKRARQRDSALSRSCAGAKAEDIDGCEGVFGGEVVQKISERPAWMVGEG